ncbi:MULTISPECIES: App1 family protein [unclassified Frigoribacterium]|uniref:App1 family protein n=1 Tax=unclassified Frigoribacterium TaxID=2627005 RepID=UPI0006F6C465|nr:MULTISPECIES: phosphatase domain-containing protein [unclassified Frigoribacterium]KQO82716.1 ACP synthase [Frigoribacterium sp. Leaf263]KQR64602.1 ACP synthase [Frigoribacterium sp. Leaf172]
MPDTRRPAPAGVEPLLHRAARIENSVHRFREKRARRRGLLPTIVPYTGYGSPGWARVLSRVLLTPAGTLEGIDRANVRGWRSFTSVPVEKARVDVVLGGRTHHLTTDRGGVLDVRVEVDLEPGWHIATVSCEGSLPVDAPVYVIDPDVRFGIVSDIDDTVMVTSLPRPFLAAWNTFVLNEHARRPVPGMSVLYERLQRSAGGCPVIYLSTGAWNVAPTLSRFLSRNLYPSGPLLLTDWGPTHDRFFRSGREHKRASLERLAAEFPHMRWLLVGDDGQHDEELYGSFLHEHPDSVAAVAIRQLSPSEAVLAGGRSRSEHAQGSDVTWVSAPDGAGLWDQLADAGIVE